MPDPIRDWLQTSVEEVSLRLASGEEPIDPTRPPLFKMLCLGCLIGALASARQPQSAAALCGRLMSYLTSDLESAKSGIDRLARIAETFNREVQRKPGGSRRERRSALRAKAR